MIAFKVRSKSSVVCLLLGFALIHVQLSLKHMFLLIPTYRYLSTLDGPKINHGMTQSRQERFVILFVFSWAKLYTVAWGAQG